jgi:hypothetical protein
MTAKLWKERRYFIGGSDARIIMGDDEAGLIRLWREKRGEIEPEDLSGNLVVQLGLATEELNRRWYEANTGQVITDIQQKVRHPALRWMAATLDGRIEGIEPPRLLGVEPPKPRIEAIRIVDMSASNSWAEFAGLFRSTREAFLDHDRSKAELKALMPEDAKEAIGHGIRAKRSKSGAVSFDFLEAEGSHAAV